MRGELAGARANDQRAHGRAVCPSLPTAARQEARSTPSPRSGRAGGARQRGVEGADAGSTRPALDTEEITVAPHSRPRGGTRSGPSPSGVSRRRTASRSGRLFDVPPSLDRVAVAAPGSDIRGVLRMLGEDPERFERAAQTELRRKTVAWARNCYTPRFRRTKTAISGVTSGGGTNRGERIMRCGRPHAAETEGSGTMQIVQKRCRDRACPGCQDCRAVKLRHELREAVGCRRRTLPVEAWSGRQWFITLTKPKVKHSRDASFDECVRAAAASIRDVLDRWSELTKGNTKLGRDFAARFSGALRALEVTFSRKGDRHGDYVVPYDGYHAHLHVLVEVSPGVDVNAALSWLRKAWCTLVGGSAAAQQGWAPLDDRNIGEIAKYIVKPMREVAGMPNVARGLFEATHRKRLLHGQGTWKSWRKWLQREPAVPRLVCTNDLGAMMRQVNRSGTTGRVLFERFGVDHDGRRIRVQKWVPAALVFDRLMATREAERERARATDPRVYPGLSIADVARRVSARCGEARELA